MPPFSSRRLLLIAAIVLLVVIGGSAALWHYRAQDAAGQGIAVVDGRSSDLPSSAEVAVGTPTAAPTTLPDFDRLSDPERQAVFASDPRDEAWASGQEATLRHRLSGLADGLSITDVTCAGHLCVVEGRLAASPARGREQAVALLKNGPLDHGYGDVGMTKLGVGTINADDDGTLTFTQYIARAA